MKKITASIFLIFLFCSLSAQEDSIKYKISADSLKTIRIYKTKISFLNKEHPIRGVFYDVTDSTIFLSNSLLKKDYLTGNFKISEINYNNVALVNIRRKHSVGKGAAIGLISGFVAGGIIGLISGGDEAFDAKDEALILGGISAIGGSILGAVIGAMKIEIPINGNILFLKSNKSVMKKYTIR